MDSPRYADELKNRTKAFAINTIRFTKDIQMDDVARILTKQLVRCATSVGANYRSACLAKSPADMIAKLKLVEEESDETIYWMELLLEVGSCEKERAALLIDEASQLHRIMVASIKTLRSRKDI